MLHIYYGKGKGKTSSALGLILRACGYNRKIILFQFLKPENLFSGEQLSLKKFPNVVQIRFNQTHPIFMQKKGTKHLRKLREDVKKSLLKLKQIIQKKDFDILICDEILNLINGEFIGEKEVAKIIGKIKNQREIILTGRNKPKDLIKIADYVTESRLIKHPFYKGTLARKSIEY